MFIKRMAALILTVCVVSGTVPVRALYQDVWEEVVSGAYKPEIYSVRFLTDGVETARLYKKGGTCIGSLPETPEREGEIFAGWFSEGKKCTEDTVVMADMDAAAVFLSSDGSYKSGLGAGEEAAPYLESVWDADLDEDSAERLEAETDEIGKVLAVLDSDLAKISVLYGTVPEGAGASCSCSLRGHALRCAGAEETWCNIHP